MCIKLKYFPAIGGCCGTEILYNETKKIKLRINDYKK